MLSSKRYHKMQIGLGVLLVAAVVLTLAAAAWPMMTAQAQSPAPGHHITPQWTQCYPYDCHGSCGSPPFGVYEYELCYSEGRGWYTIRICVDNCVW